MRLKYLFPLLAFVVAAYAQNPDTVRQSQTEAVREFPALAQPGSDFNKQFVQRYNALRTVNDPSLTKDDWPLHLAQQLAAELGVAPAPAATPTPALAPAPSAALSTPPAPTPRSATTGPAAATRDNPFVNSLGMKFVPIPGIKPLFSVYDTRVQDYRAYAEANPGVRPAWKNPGFSQTDTDPVTTVLWKEANAFCKWLTAKDRAAGLIGQDMEYRLPTDAEWTAAAGSTKYPWGDNWPPPKGAGNYSPKLGLEDYANTSPVGTFPPNQYGLYDMGGNVWQWCQDWYNSNMNDPATVAKYKVLRTDSGHKAHVIRGGAYYVDQSDLMVTAARASDHPTDANGGNGFRCVLAPAAPAGEDSSDQQ